MTVLMWVAREIDSCSPPFWQSTVTHFKKVMQRVWPCVQTRLAFTIVAFNVLVQWHGFLPNASGFVPLSMAEFGL